MSNKSTAATVKESLTTGDLERFERWASDDGEYPKAIERVGVCYRLAQTQASWMAWHKCSTENPAIAVIDAQAAEIEQLEEALYLALEYWTHRQQRYKNRTPAWVQKARAALSGEPT